jgi:hypothetical protein
VIVHHGGNLGLIDFEDGTPHSAADRPVAHLSKSAKGGAPSFSSLPAVKTSGTRWPERLRKSKSPPCAQNAQGGAPVRAGAAALSG